MSYFDYNLIGDEGIRNDYRHLQERAERIAASLTEGYGKSRLPIEFRYINENEFNAFASRGADRYWVEVNAAVPLFVIILFYRLFGDQRLLPHLDASGSLASDFALPFIIDPNRFDRRVNWRIAANPIRAFAAGTIADLCNTFVILHEFAHILCGHTEGLQHYDGGKKIAELVSRSQTAKQRSERWRAWEADADMIAAGFLVQFVTDLVDLSETDDRVRQVFSDKGGFHLEHTLAIAVSALFAFFCYVQGARTQLGKANDHPHPQVRALYVKDVLFQEASKRRTLNEDIFHALLDQRLDEMMDVLKDIKLFDARKFSPAFSREIDLEHDELAVLQAKFRDSCASWTWLEP